MPQWKALAFDDDDYFESEKDRILKPPVPVESDSDSDVATSADHVTSNKESASKWVRL